MRCIQRAMLRQITALVCLLLLCACGNKGDLFLPTDDTSTQSGQKKDSGSQLERS